MNSRWYRFLFGIGCLLCWAYAWMPPAPVCHNMQEVQDSSFEKLMGQKAPCWKHFQGEKNKEIFHVYKTIYEKKKHLLFDASLQTYKIPKIIHFIWLGPKNFPLDSIKHVRSWIQHHPDWTIKFWTDRKRPPPCQDMHVCYVQDFSFQFLQKLYKESTNWGEKSDLLRYEILLQEGGVYTDHDSNCLQPFDNLHKAYDFYCCLEQPHFAVEGYNITVGNGLLGTRKDHPLIKTAIENVINRWYDIKRKYPQNDAIHKMHRVLSSGYMSLNFALHQKLKNSSYEDIVLPASYFFGHENVFSIYSQHFYQTAWLEGWQKKDFHNQLYMQIVRTKRDMYQVIFLQIGIVVSIGLFFYSIRRRRCQKFS